MIARNLRVVLDTNVLVAGLASHASASRQIVDALTARRAIPLLSDPVLSEYRAILARPSIIAHFRGLTSERLALALQRLRYVADEIPRPKVRFPFPRDPREAIALSPPRL